MCTNIWLSIIFFCGCDFIWMFLLFVISLIRIRQQTGFRHKFTQSYWLHICTKKICKYKIFRLHFCWFWLHFVKTKKNDKLFDCIELIVSIFTCSCSARFLWKRIPLQIKTGNVALEKIHNVYVCLWNNDIAGFFKIINYEWSSNIAELMFELRGT